MKLFHILLLSMLIFANCSKKQDKFNTDDNTEENSDGKCSGAEHATIVDRTGLDGCTWMLKLDNGSHLEPTNLSDFGIELVDNKSVVITYKERGDLVSICMAGPIVDITCMEED
jgi:hypothetical protein